jgi:hypothetical protein
MDLLLKGLRYAKYLPLHAWSFWNYYYYVVSHVKITVQLAKMIIMDYQNYKINVSGVYGVI